MNKAHENQNWKNFPSKDTPVNEANLNKLDLSVDEIDDRVISLDTSKFDKTEAAGLLKSLTLNTTTGVFTITYYNGSKETINTTLGKVAVNFDFDPTTQSIILTLEDGTIQPINLSAFITPTEFVDTDTIGFSDDGEGKVSANVLDGSIKEKHLQPNYLADIKVESAKAEASATTAKSYAVGGTGSRTGEDTDNAKYYSEKAAEYAGQFIDDTTKLKYRLGIDNGLVYVEPV